ncbi:hypothetical protein SEA_SERENITY_46 [Mycobacterium phage Serenity]|uniref:hypothetical protein n=1 Tax=Mycobacterium phage Serenity TaxID=1701853 RepID=UPI0006CE3A21|nr:hypothetical protein SEA_SERENITY_46 [Mycobacterium phage Serenity]ALF00913.1 hypothetical protein SEA_SERENITY_46 [Mycobacterium phage Serenity]
MADRIVAILAVPVDDALPIDVQAVGLRRKAIDLMKEIAEIDENTVRYKGATDNGTITFGGSVGLVSVWQHNMIAARFTADGKASREIVGPIVQHDKVTRTFSSVGFVRDEY